MSLSLLVPPPPLPLQPLTVALLAAALFGEKLGPTAVAGLMMGVLGLLLVEVPLDGALMGERGGMGQD